jgi:hypothetical protein
VNAAVVEGIIKRPPTPKLQRSDSPVDAVVVAGHVDHPGLAPRQDGHALTVAFEIALPALVFDVIAEIEHELGK